MGSDDFNVSLIVKNKTVSTDYYFGRERRAEADSNRGPSAYQPNALPLGQTGSPLSCLDRSVCSACRQAAVWARHCHPRGHRHPGFLHEQPLQTGACWLPGNVHARPPGVAVRGSDRRMRRHRFTDISAPVRSTNQLCQDPV